MKYLRVTLLVLTVVLIGCDKEEINSSTPTNIDKQLLVSLVNEYRITGCNCGSEYFPPVNPIVWNDNLELAAISHSEDMNNNDFFNHTGSDGSNPSDRVTRFDYNWSTMGENIAKGYFSEQEVIEGWINSVGHCKNIMNSNFEHMGVAKSGSYWTQVFGAH